ncbi:alpha/beta hydrolase [Paenibacillus glycanilyticus]|uniref:alpha/beta fold hydrolase n=1 Tax=Paenibacillus glycanilyticus TaxID=126569 RepID=UPI0020415A1F|nr:alpha/beta hydrolase [Paenibacillus glycanilyticus]MCM3626188.1 alpha/beta hydrolase [Paenibacillus glycanilyticus]
MIVLHKTATVNGLNIFYREAGSKDRPTILLLHGFPSSSHMFRNLIVRLADSYHIIAPDYPGFGNSDQPSTTEFDYTFDNLAHVINGFVEQLGLNKYSLYVHDYGAPVGFRLMVMHPERVQAIITQNGNAYEEGLIEATFKPIMEYWRDAADETNRNQMLGLLKPELTKFQYVNGTRNPEAISPDAYKMDQLVLDQPGNSEIQLALFYDYQNNIKQYPVWHESFRSYQPPTLVAWGKNDIFFGPAGALAFQKDLKDAEVHLLDTGHFPLEEDLEASVALIKRFLADRLPKD